MFDPAVPGPGDDHYLHEEYRRGDGPSRALAVYYRLKPALPRSVQTALRRGLAWRRAEHGFPSWPIEDVLLRQRAGALARELDARGAERIRTVNPWPDGHRFAVILTHDVEGPLGVKRIPEILELERRYGFVSSWNFVGDWYPLADADLAIVRDAGCEVGLHGISHDGRLFRSRSSFERSLPEIRRYLESWQAVGFRSPSTLRNAPWMHELPVLYDSSFPDTDPFQPQPGGCCWIWPFFFGDVVELPITLDQDHTLFVLLRERSIERWARKSEWLMAQRGLINVIVHPDYMEPGRLELYEDFLRFLSTQQGGWHALPRDVATWWKERSALCNQLDDPAHAVPAQALGRASLVWARVADEQIVYES